MPGDKQRNGTFGKRERGVEDDSSHRLTVPEKAVTVSKVTTDMEHGTPIIKADIECVERSLIVDTGSDVSILQPGISKASIRNTTLRPYGVSGETLDVKGQQTVSLRLGRRKFDHTFLVCPLPTEAAGLLGTDFLEGRGAHINFENGKVSLNDTAQDDRASDDELRQRRVLTVFTSGKEGQPSTQATEGGKQGRADPSQPPNRGAYFTRQNVAFEGTREHSIGTPV